VADLRERLKALVEEWRELPKHYMLRAHLTADQVAAILAESEPHSLPLGPSVKELVERLWASYESALAADGDDGCEHTPDGDLLVCWACRKRRFELVAEPMLSELLVARCAHGREKCWACDQVAEANRLGAKEVAAILAESEPGCEVCAGRARVADESARFLSDVEEGKRILAESESDKTYVGTMSAQGDRWVEHATRTDPKSLPLGHEFIQSIDILGKSTTGGCCFSIVCLECGQPRSAHESKGIA